MGEAERRDRGVLSALEALPLAGEGGAAVFLDELGAAFRMAMTAAYRPTALQHCGGLDFLHARGFKETQLDAFTAALSSGGSVLNFDPVRPPRSHRNRAVDVWKSFPRSDTHPTGSYPFWRSVGLGDHEQMRVLVCEADTLLAWVGGFRETPFRPLELRRLERLAQPMRRALSIDRKLRDARLDRLALEAALERLGSPAFVAHGGGRVEVANRWGRDIYDRSPGATRQLLADAIARRHAGGSPGVELVPLDASSGGDTCLVLLTRPPEEIEGRLRAAAIAFGLTPRQSEVLRLVASGDANKTIAERLGCTEATVEAHATAIYRKAGVDGRTALVAKILRAPPAPETPPGFVRDPIA